MAENIEVYAQEETAGVEVGYDTIRGESAYEAAVRLGLTNLTEEEWISEYTAKRDEAISDVEAAGDRVAAEVAGVFDDEVAQGKEELADATALQQTAISDHAEAVRASLPGVYTALDSRVRVNTNKLKTKADAIMDASSRAACHELHIQSGSNIKVKMYGKTTQSGSGEASPGNPRPISGVDTAKLWTSGKNLFSTEFGVEKEHTSGITTEHLTKNMIRISVARTGNGLFTSTYIFPIALPPGTYAVSANNEKVAGDGADLTGIKIWCRATDLEYIGTSAVYLNVRKATRVFTTTKPIGSLILRVGENMMTADNLDVNLQLERSPTSTAFEPYSANIIEIPLDAPLYGDGVTDDTVENDASSPSITGAYQIWRRWGVINSYAGEEITTEYISSTGGLDTGAQVIYKLDGTMVTNGSPAYVLESTGALPEIVMGSGETEVTYVHDTKHYIDEKFAALSAALIGG